MQARCRLGFERKVELLFIGSASWAKTRTQSPKQGVVETGKPGSLSGCSCVERHVRLLSGPDAMEQYSQLARYRNYGLALGLLATSCCQMQPPLPEGRVLP
jgi:hypothetical protein